MRVLAFFVCLLLVGTSRAQQFFPGNLGYSSSFNRPAAFASNDSSSKVKKWSLQKYSSLSLGMMMWKGGSVSYISAPVGLQLNRRITNNLFAFAGISVAPSIINFRQSFINPDFKNTGLRGMNQSYGLGMYSQAEIGLGYTNDARTFEIRGSISVQRNDFPFQSGNRLTTSNRNKVNFMQ